VIAHQILFIKLLSKTERKKNDREDRHHYGERRPRENRSHQRNSERNDKTTYSTDDNNREHYQEASDKRLKAKCKKKLTAEGHCHGTQPKTIDPKHPKQPNQQPFTHTKEKYQTTAKVTKPKLKHESKQNTKKKSKTQQSDKAKTIHITKPNSQVRTNGHTNREIQRKQKRKSRRYQQRKKKCLIKQLTSLTTKQQPIKKTTPTKNLNDLIQLIKTPLDKLNQATEHKYKENKKNYETIWICRRHNKNKTEKHT